MHIFKHEDALLVRRRRRGGVMRIFKPVDRSVFQMTCSLTN